MKIIADENIPFVREAFAGFGDVLTVPGRKITPGMVRSADILLVRSVTKADRNLLKNSRLKFVATATTGTDHIDLDYLRREGIGFSNAAGSNANSVAEYVFAALFDLALRFGWTLSDKTLGVIGVGHIGSKVAARARSLGMAVLENDPPLKRETGDPRFLPLKEVLLNADILTWHVPLTFGGIDKTFHLMDAKKLACLKSGSVLINTSRGPVVDNAALKEKLKKAGLQPVVLDVWENEPHIDSELLSLVTIGTPHTAGYSFDAKVNGTRMIYDAVCKFLGREPAWRPEKLVPPPAVPELIIRAGEKRDEEIIQNIIQKVYAIREDDRRLRKITALPEAERGAYFDALRRDYPVRREFSNTRIKLENGRDSVVKKLWALGFRVSA
ncbi:erythronate-4-phosphate dehydrogenase [bacterium BMS3Abin05]|nr:erythronate-4-phosphate dehydrogenase [bacterium BMS3Abin05]